MLTDLKNKTGLSIYFWETEANGGHIEGTTWGVQWRYRNENKNSGIFYWKLTNEICWLDTNWMTKFPILCSDATEIANMAAVGPFKMAAVGKNKSILWSSQNSNSNIYVWSCRKKHIGCITGCILNLFQKPQSRICLQTPSFGWSFQDGRQLASKPVHQNNELLHPVLFLRSVVVLRTFTYIHTQAQCTNQSLRSFCLAVTQRKVKHSSKQSRYTNNK